MSSLKELDSLKSFLNSNKSLKHLPSQTNLKYLNLFLMKNLLKNKNISTIYLNILIKKVSKKKLRNNQNSLINWIKCSNNLELKLIPFNQILLLQKMLLLIKKLKKSLFSKSLLKNPNNLKMNKKVNYRIKLMKRLRISREIIKDLNELLAKLLQPNNKIKKVRLKNSIPNTIYLKLKM